MNEKKIKELLSWLNMDEISAIQLSYFHISSLPVGIYTVYGTPLMDKKGGTTYCDILVQQNKSASSMCHKCRLYNAREAFELNRGVCCYCHMGLITFSAPIVVEGELIGYMTSGMVFDRPPVERDILALAGKFDIDPVFLREASLKVPVKDPSFLELACEGLFNYAEIISKSAYIRIQSHRAGEEVERAARMKNDFLANMSHEIRTPMNAVIGMAELATQENISDTAREYLENIQSSGKTLLHIINDILDYSKISSGKMSIFEDNFSVATLIRDVTSIITTRLNEKHGAIYLYIDVAPHIPATLVGDVARIQQIIINLANNAVKFTNSGYIRISFDGHQGDDNIFRLNVSVKDTGIGIKHDDQEKLFNSFTQVDSRRNRNVEGTGLGLAIVRQLVSLMNGEVSLESSYGVGSTFSFSIPLPISGTETVCNIPDSSEYCILMTIDDSNVFSALHTAFDALSLHVRSLDISECTPASLSKWISEYPGKKLIAAIDQKVYDAGFIEKSGLGRPGLDNVRVMLIPDSSFEDKKSDLPAYVSILKYPVTTIGISSLLTDSPAKERKSEEKTSEIRFIAPDAKIMVVDDIPMNLKLAERLLSRLQIKADLASSGQEALELLVKDQYDLIFMDHMMPGLDGIDTTRLIRRFHAKYNKTPIIALTANVMEDAKKMFIDEGMSDIIPKPIEVKTLHEKLLKWLPPEKIVRVNNP